jgi:hypothetical protein
MDILEKKLKKEAERIKSLEKSDKLINENIKAIAERFVDELKLKGLEEALKPETIGIRSNKAVKIMLDVVADATGLEKKELITYFVFRAFVEVWDGTPEPVKQYYRYKFKEIDEVYEFLKLML